MKIRSENGKIENFQGFTRFVAKSLKIWPIFLKKSTGNLEFWQKKSFFHQNFLSDFVRVAKRWLKKGAKQGKKGFIAFLCDNIS